MATSIKFPLRILGVLGVLAVPFFQLSARADDASTLLNAPRLPPYQWFASTDPKHQNADYVLLKPNETRRVPLAKGVLLRLWSTALEPDKIELALQNNSSGGTRVELLKNGKAALGNYYQKAFTLYPGVSTPAAARDLKDGAALIVVNRSSKTNKWFYQVTVRPRASTPVAPPPAASAIVKEEKIDWNSLQPSLKAAALRGKKIFGSVKNGYQFCVASGSARAQKGQPIPILKIDGEGAFVGLVLDIRPAPDAHRRTFAFLEGNETLIADGKKYEGTGTEDFFNSAWYFPDKPFSQPYHGLTQKSTEPPSVTAYRWMIPDAVSFKKHFEFQFEHGNGNADNDMEWRWVAFWYQKTGGKFEIADALKNGSAPEYSPPPPGSDSREALHYNPALVVVSLTALAGGLIVIGWALWSRARR